jgi:hypothetical protein
MELTENSELIRIIQLHSGCCSMFLMMQQDFGTYARYVQCNTTDSGRTDRVPTESLKPFL